MKKYFYSVLLMATIQVHAQSPDETAVRQVLNDQINAWNQGDLDNFMKTYWKNDSLMFIGKSGITYGWSKTLENYKKTTRIPRQWVNLCSLFLTQQNFHRSIFILLANGN